jgi:hypothetical protein
LVYYGAGGEQRVRGGGIREMYDDDDDDDDEKGKTSGENCMIRSFETYCHCCILLQRSS